MAFDLDVWMNGERVGAWYATRTGASAFRYHEEWLASARSRPISLSVPITLGNPEVRGPQVYAFFDNLLPDNDVIRRRLQVRFGAASTSAPDLLAVLGRDCVGALQLLPAGSDKPDPRVMDSEALDEGAIEKILEDVTSTTPRVDPSEDLRVSIAGAQEKTALLRIGKRWHRPHGATPTTHILKLPLGLVGNRGADMTTSIENEWLCAQLLSELGFEVARTDIATFGKQKVLVVERFDRSWVDQSWIARLPQEDFCQALSVPWTQKYEVDGGPGIRAALELLAGSERGQRDRLAFAMTQLAFWLMAALDGHAKNFSIFLLPGGKFRLTPLYDVLSMWPIIGRGPNEVAAQKARLAMAVRSKNPHYHLREIVTRHWRHVAAQSAVPGAFGLMTRLVESVPTALDNVEARLPASFPAKVWNPVRAGMLNQCRLFEMGLTGSSTSLPA